MRMIKTLTLTGALGLGLLAAGTAARADILPALSDPTVTSLGGGLFQYDYHPVVTHTQQVETSDYFTIYDFPGLTSASAPTGWSVSIQPLGVTPFVLPIDSASVPNVTFTYSGPTIVGGPLPLGTFSLVSPYTNLTMRERNWAGRGTDIDSGLKNGNITNIAVPTTAPVVPEPGTMALLGLGAAPLIGRLRRRTRKA